MASSAFYGKRIFTKSRGLPHTFSLMCKSLAEVSSCGRFNTRPVRKENSSGRNQQSNCSFYSHWTAYCHGISSFMFILVLQVFYLSAPIPHTLYNLKAKVLYPNDLLYCFLEAFIVDLTFYLKAFRSHVWFAVFRASWFLKGNGMKGFKLIDISYLHLCFDEM